MKTLYETIGLDAKLEDILLDPPAADAIIRCGTRRLYYTFVNRKTTGATHDDVQGVADAIEILLDKQSDYLQVVRTFNEDAHDRWVRECVDAQQEIVNSTMADVVCFNVGRLRMLELRNEHDKDAFFASDGIEFHGLPKEMHGAWMHGAVSEELMDTLNAVTLRDSFRRIRGWLDGDYNGVESNAFQILWRNGSFKVGGATAVASVRALSQKDRTRLNTEAKVEMSISLPYWLCATEKEREALIAHELRHLAVDYNEDTGEWKVKSNVPHNVQAFIEDLADTGVQDECQAMLVAAALQHPEIAKQLEHYEVLKGEQLDLFKQFADNLALSSMAVQEQERRELVAIPRGASLVTFSSGGKSVTLTAKSGQQ
jgi:hypothetical protein